MTPIDDLMIHMIDMGRRGTLTTIATDLQRATVTHHHPAMPMIVTHPIHGESNFDQKYSINIPSDDPKGAYPPKDANSAYAHQASVPPGKFTVWSKFKEVS